jgi:RNA polymerase sigma factor (sigma-70 family)
MNRELDEYELARRARAGDREALAELVERTRLGLFALAYAELRHYEDAQDAVAAALLQVCLHVAELRQPERIRAWMHRIVRNEAHRLRRGLDTSPLRWEQAAAERISIAEPSLLLLDIERALRRLPGNQAEVVRLFYLHHLSLDEIARRLGRSQGTIGSWLHRGRRHLANEMEGYAPMTPTKLERLGISLERIRDETLKRVTRGAGSPGGPMQFTPEAKHALDLNHWEARGLNDNYLGTEHQLLGLIREGEGLAGEVLRELGVNLERTRQEVQAMRAEEASART